jgi:hypothetical protein
VIHDPTTLNRHGNDIGTQYRSGIYFHEPSRRGSPRGAAQVNELHRGKVVTEVLPESNYSRPRPITSTISRPSRTRLLRHGRGPEGGEVQKTFAASKVTPAERHSYGVKGRGL